MLQLEGGGLVVTDEGELEMMPQGTRWDVGCQSEYDRLKRVLLHEPGPELLAGLLWPRASSYEESFDSQAAADEHKGFQRYLKNKGIAVYLLEDLLAGHPDLRERAATAITFSNTTPQNSSDLEKVVSALSALDLIRVLVERPELDIDGTPDDPKFRSMATNPLSNLYFMRDQLIVTNMGVILGRFKEAVRQGEQQVVELALEVLGIDVLYRIDDPGVLEGGDFIPVGDWALIGCGERTNYEAINQLLTGEGAEALGYGKVAVVKDPDPDIQEMHLDTYFMPIARDTCLVEATRLYGPTSQEVDRRPYVDIYEQSISSEGNLVYNLVQQDVFPFVDFLRNELGMSNPVSLTIEDQLAYGVNVLCLEEGKVVGSFSEHQDESHRRDYQQRVGAAGIDFEPLFFTNIRKGFGSNHCMSQALLRG